MLEKKILYSAGGDYEFTVNTRKVPYASTVVSLFLFYKIEQGNFIGCMLYKFVFTKVKKIRFYFEIV